MDVNTIKKRIPIKSSLIVIGLITLTFFISRGITYKQYENLLESQKMASQAKIDSLERLIENREVRIDTFIKRVEVVSQNNKSRKNEIDKKKNSFITDTNYLNNARVIAREVERRKHLFRPDSTQ